MKKPQQALSGVLSMLYSSFSFSLMALCVKWASPGIPSPEIVFFRSVLGVLMTYAVIHRKKLVLGGEHWRPLVLRGLSGFAALSLYFYTLSRLPLGTAVLLNYTSPVFSTLLAVLFLKERPNLILICMTLSAFAGIYLLVDQPQIADPTAVWTGLLSAVCAAVAYVSIRAIKHRVPPVVVIFYFTLISTIGSLFFLPQAFVMPGLLEWLAIAGIGVFSYYGQLWLTMALQRTPASLVVPFSYLTPLLSFCYGFIFWREHIALKEAAGIIMIIAASTVISIFGKTKEEEQAK
ncbi:MAG: EamA family transporter [Candidatus Omnitrophica bacterium]|nr:EamA family transporter [Candidatus Omnitrophota bacterium]